MEDDVEGIYAILMPVSGPNVRQGMLSRPVLSLMDFPVAYKTALRHEILLTLKYTPKIWRFLIQLFPGSKFISRQAYEPINVPPAVRSMEVEEPPGLSALLSDFGHAMRVLRWSDPDLRAPFIVLLVPFGVLSQ